MQLFCLFIDNAGAVHFSNSISTSTLRQEQLFTLRCTSSDFGYPAPNVTIDINNQVISSSNQGHKDAFGGERVSASLTATARKQWQGKRATCRQQQHGFPDKVKSIEIKVYCKYVECCCRLHLWQC